MPRLARLAPLLFAGLIACTPAPVFAAESIPTMDVRITVNADASLLVQEQIVYDFADTPNRHGIYRDIPLAFTTADGRTGHLTLANLVVIDEQGAPYETSVSTAGGVEHIRIGNPNATVSGTKTYLLSYVVRGAVTPYAHFDEVYWNATGDQWTVPINASSATVTLPAAVPEGQVRVTCYTGSAGSKTSCPTHISSTGNTAVAFTGPALAPGEGLTVAVGFPTGLVTYPPPIPWWRQWLATLIAGVLLVAAIIFAIAFAWHDKKGRGTIIPIYEPPARAPGETPLRPAEADVLVHGRVGKRAWPATVVDLAVRGYVKIVEDAPLPWWRLSWRTDYTVTGLKSDTAGLEAYEQAFVAELLTGGAFSTRALRRNPAGARALYYAVKKVESDLRKETASDTSAYLLDPETAQQRTVGVGLIAGLLLILIATLPGAIAGSFWTYADETFGAMGLVLAIAIAAYPVYLKPRLNRGGAIEREQWLGFKLYLETAEKYRLQNLTPETFQTFLPYAMVFGIEKKWAKAFAGITMPPPNWYSGSAAAGAFSASSFTSNFSSSFASSFAASGAGGASGGGGGAGGGGGGGGGGGW